MQYILSYDCSCTDADTYAYVYPDSFGEIYLCGVCQQPYLTLQQLTFHSTTGTLPPPELILRLEL